MGCSDVKVTEANITQRIYGLNSQSGEQTWRPEGFNEYCSPEIEILSETVEREKLSADTFAPLWKVDVQWEETVKSTTKAAGIGVLASKERFTEITTGRSYFQQR